MKIIIFKTFYIFIFFSIALTNWYGAFTYNTSLKTKLGTFQAGEKIINIKYLAILQPEIFLLNIKTESCLEKTLTTKKSFTLILEFQSLMTNTLIILEKDMLFGKCMG